MAEAGLVTGVASSLHILTLGLASLGTCHDYRYCNMYYTSGLLGNFMSILLLSSTVASRFCNLLIMLAYVDIRNIVRNQEHFSIVHASIKSF